MTYEKLKEELARLDKVIQDSYLEKNQLAEQFIEQQELKNGDIVMWGETKFRVWFLEFDEDRNIILIHV